MRSVAEYLEKAAEFDELARSTSEPVIKKRYADVAESYRLLRSCGNGSLKQVLSSRNSRNPVCRP
jgi:hypothetical protein